MKKIFKYMAILLISIISFSSCAHTIGKEKPMVIISEKIIDNNKGLSEYIVKTYGYIAKGHAYGIKFVEDSDMFEVGDTVKFAKVR